MSPVATDPVWVATKTVNVFVDTLGRFLVYFVTVYSVLLLDITVYEVGIFC